MIRSLLLTIIVCFTITSIRGQVRIDTVTITGVKTLSFRQAFLDTISVTHIQLKQRVAQQNIRWLLKSPQQIKFLRNGLVIR